MLGLLGEKQVLLLQDVNRDTQKWKQLQASCDNDGLNNAVRTGDFISVQNRAIPDGLALCMLNL